ncbi:MAG: OmpA family protein [Vicingus serpentipes]|nr:OmpA family protein [Vicingus serpentipes]
MMKKALLITSIALLSFAGYTQDNLVPNHDFQIIEKKVKDKGAIESALPWTSPTLAKADLYIEKTKNYSISVPENAYGEEKPMEGDNYAGIIAYSYKGKVPRSYLQVKLTEKLKAGQEYCVTMNVSLADLSKYACNYIGVAVSDKEITANNSEVLQFDAQILSRKLVVYEQQYYWTPICGVYKAKGGEEFITIGNFTPDDKLTTKKVKRPTGFNKPQLNDAYYFIDNISVVLKDEDLKCNCDAIEGMENAETVNRNFSSDKTAKQKEIKIINSDGSVGPGNENTSGVAAQGSTGGSIDGMVISFKPKANSIVGNSTAIMDKIVAYMKANPNDKIMISGYIDESEKDVDKLDGKRVGTVYKYLLSKGISKDRIEREVGGADAPVDESNAVKNMRVEIALIQEQEGEDEEGNEEE